MLHRLLESVSDEAETRVRDPRAPREDVCGRTAGALGARLHAVRRKAPPQTATVTGRVKRDLRFTS
jgi:hypothetical protein